jgi:hypothetical protein
MMVKMMMICVNHKNHNYQRSKIELWNTTR